VLRVSINILCNCIFSTHLHFFLKENTVSYHEVWQENYNGSAYAYYRFNFILCQFVSEKFYIFQWISRNPLFCWLTISTSQLLYAELRALMISKIHERYCCPSSWIRILYIYGCLIYSFLRPTPSKQRRIIITTLHPHLIYQLQSSHKSFSLKRHCEPAVSNYSTMSNSVISRQGSLMGATMSNKAVCFPISRSIGGYTERDLIGARASCGVPVPRSFVYGYSPWIGSSFGPSFRSNIPPLPSMEWNCTGATMSNKAVCFPCTSQGSSYVERDLLGAEMSCHTPLPNSSMYFGVHYYINAYPPPAVAGGLLGAEMSSQAPRPNSSMYVGVQPIKRWASRAGKWTWEVANI
jgi:hypothetical protein